MSGCLKRNWKNFGGRLLERNKNYAQTFRAWCGEFSLTSKFICMQNKFSVCKGGVCLQVEGQWAETFAAIFFGIMLAYGTVQVAKLLS
jgi:hypothetical protein